MSHGKLRDDTTCLNCGSTVEEKFCPHCGQENAENRKPFHYLFTHFVEDFTHYDGQFWGTIKNLLFKPGKLTVTYIEGKRQRYVPPVKLYIFISFVTFFLFSLFPPFHIDFNGQNTAENSGKNSWQNTTDATRKVLDSMKAQRYISPEDSVAIQRLDAIVGDSAAARDLAASLDMNTKLNSKTLNGYTNKKSFDSAQVKNPSTFDFISVPVAHKFFELQEKGAKKGDILKNLVENAFHNLPKALFIYLPVFAFFLWIFHNKKKWWYFEHGVFTLHYFAFLLLNILLFSFLSKANTLIDFKFVNVIINVLMIAMLVYSLLYFFIAHRRVYHSQGIVSFAIGISVFLLNFIAFMFLVIGIALISFLTIH